MFYKLCIKCLLRHHMTLSALLVHNMFYLLGKQSIISNMTPSVVFTWDSRYTNLFTYTKLWTIRYLWSVIILQPRNSLHIFGFSILGFNSTFLWASLNALKVCRRSYFDLAIKCVIRTYQLGTFINSRTSCICLSISRSRLKKQTWETGMCPAWIASLFLFT